MFPSPFSIYCQSQRKLSSSIEAKLLKNDIKLEDFLDEDDIVFNLKLENKKLMKFFNREIIKQLIKYITIENENDDLLYGHKYPFVSYEILYADIHLISDYFVYTEKDYFEKNKYKLNDNLNKEEDNEENNCIIIDDDIDNEKEDKIIENILKETIENNQCDENNFEILDYLLNFVMNDNINLNHVLSGYFSNIMMKLIDKYTNKILKYLYLKRKDVLEKIMKHSNNKAISELAIKVLKLKNLIFNLEEEKKEEEEIYNYRNILIINFIKDISIENKNNDSDIKCSLLMELIEDKIILNLFIEKKEIYNHIFEILSFEINSNDKNEITNCYSSIIKLLTKIIEQIEIKQLPLPKNFDINRNNFSDNLIKILDKIIINFTERKNSKIIPSQFDKPYKSLGIINQNIMELFILLLNYFQEISEKFDEIIINNNFIKKSLNFFFIFEWNNIYQNTFVKFIKSYLDKVNIHEKLTYYLFDELEIYQSFENFLLVKSNFIYKSGNKIKNSLFPHIIEIIYKINSIIGNEIFTDDLNSKNKNEGDFTFIQCDNSNKNQIYNLNIDRIFNNNNVINNNNKEEKKENKIIKKNETIKKILKEKEYDWVSLINDIISPTVKLYEMNLCREETIKQNEFQSTQLFIKLMDVIQESQEKLSINNQLNKNFIKNNNKSDYELIKDNTNLNILNENIIEEKSKYNDLNYWKSNIFDSKTIENCLKDLL